MYGRIICCLELKSRMAVKRKTGCVQGACQRQRGFEVEPDGHVREETSRQHLQVRDQSEHSRQINLGRLQPADTINQRAFRQIRPRRKHNRFPRSRRCSAFQ